MHAKFLASFVVLVLVAPMATADLIVSPPHSHQNSPVTTFAHDPLPNRPTHRHQHRTGHDPLQGTKTHGSGAGAEPYKANLPGQVWVGRTFIVAGSAGTGGTSHGNNESEHGHQGHEIDFGRYHVHPAVAGGDISDDEAKAWNDAAKGAAVMAKFGYDLWNAAGTASGARNWPGTDNDEGPPPANGVPWHSSVEWRMTTGTDHEVHIVYGEAVNALADTSVGTVADVGFPGGHHSVLTITMDDDQPWFYGTTGNPANTQFDFATLLLHEQGHVLGLDHFGGTNTSYIMRPNFGKGEFTRVIDPDAVHGVRDLYAIANREAGTISIAPPGDVGIGPGDLVSPKDVVVGPGINVDAFSYGFASPFSATGFIFSVDAGSVGVDGTAVATQAGAGGGEGVSADTYFSTFGGTNVLWTDGDGSAGSPTSGPAGGLPETVDVDALDFRNASPSIFAASTRGFWSVDPATIASEPAYEFVSPADILDLLPWPDEYPTPGVYATAADLGLEPTDDIDALEVIDVGGFGFDDPGDMVVFSLAPGSPFLATGPFSAADIFFKIPGAPIGVFASAASLGLDFSDDLNALSSVPEPSSLALMAMAALGIGGFRGWRRVRHEKGGILF